MNAKYIMEKNSHFTFICILKHKTFLKIHTLSNIGKAS